MTCRKVVEFGRFAQRDQLAHARLVGIPRFSLVWLRHITLSLHLVFDIASVNVFSAVYASLPVVANGIQEGVEKQIKKLDPCRNLSFRVI